MAQNTVLELLPQIPYNGNNPNHVGSKQPAAAYYLAGKDLQTIQWSFNNVSANFIIQASLATNPNENNDNDWFHVYETTVSSSSEISYYNLTGNFVWVRAKLTNFTQGVVRFAKLSY